MKVHYPKLYNMTHLALNVSLLPKDLTIIFISRKNHPAQSIVGKDNPANSLDQRMNRRVSPFM